MLVSVSSLTTKISLLRCWWPHNQQLPWPAKMHARLQQHCPGFTFKGEAGSGG